LATEARGLHRLEAIILAAGVGAGYQDDGTDRRGQGGGERRLDEEAAAPGGH